MTSQAAKGNKGGACNRSACNNRPAIYFNSSTRAYYCETCAARINTWNGKKICLLEQPSANEKPALKPFFVITSQGFGIREATDIDACEELLEREIGSRNIVYVKEADDQDIRYCRAKRASMPDQYRG